jgi:signal transduction histidine kinase
LPWQPWEVAVASSFLLTLAREELRNRVISESEARAEAERANRTKQEFIGAISHDLRDPLSSLRLSLLVLKKVLSADSRQAAAPTLASMDRAVTQMSGLVKGLLELSAIEGGNLKLELQPTLVHQVLHDCIDVFAPLAAEKNIELRLQVQAKPITVRADRDQLLQVCSNLIGNAIKFTPEGGSVEVRLRESPNCVHVDVADSGPGIASEDLPHIFDRF